MTAPIKYVVVVPQAARNHSTNEPALFSFEAVDDAAAVVYVNSREGMARFSSGGVNWRPASKLRRSDGGPYILFRG